MFLGTFDEKIFLFRSGRPPIPTNPMATLAVLAITTTVATLTTRMRDLGNLSDLLIQKFVEPMSRCYTTDPKKRWEYCDVPLYKDYLNPATKGADYTGKISKTKSGRDCQVFHPHPIHPKTWGLIYGSVCLNMMSTYVIYVTKFTINVHKCQLCI